MKKKRRERKLGGRKLERERKFRFEIILHADSSLVFNTSSRFFILFFLFDLI